jgi:FAD-dependent oxidoreductase domain-containing protein 1
MITTAWYQEPGIASIRDMNKVDVLIAGGGVMGSATAVQLLVASPTLDVVIVEPDPGYTQAASVHGSGGIRQLFTRPENIALSQYTLSIVEDWNRWAGIDGQPVLDLEWRPHGYLFIARPGEAEALAAECQGHVEHGVDARWWEPEELAERCPQLHTADLAGAVFSPRDGWLDPKAFFAQVRAKARSLGARFRTDRVVGFDISGRTVRSVQLASGHNQAATVVVNTAGCWAPELAARAGMPIPVEPMRRHEYHIVGSTDLGGLPFVKDAAGLALRPHRSGLSVGLVDFNHPGGFDFSCDDTYFDASVRPALTHRIPALTKLQLRRTRVGLYDQNRFDGNMIIGNWPGRLDNFFLACGFSGHGFMHAPGVGRALAELILHGEYLTIDLQRMGYQRILDDQPYAEHAIR